MPTNLDTERDIQHRTHDYPAAAAADIAWLLAETARLRDAAADEHKQRIAAEESATRALLDRTDTQVQVRTQGEIVRAQSQEIADRDATIRLQGEEIATLRGMPEMRMVIDPATVGSLLSLLKDLSDDEPCRTNHLGYCQTHGLSPPCPHRRAQRVLARAHAPPTAARST